MSDRGHATLAAVAAWYYDVCELYEDDDLDPENHVEFVRRAFTSSDCGDVAYALHVITGWPVCQLGLHACVEAPDGRLLDATGWTTAVAVARPYGVKMTRRPLRVEPTAAAGFTIDPDDAPGGYNETPARTVSAVRALP